MMLPNMARSSSSSRSSSRRTSSTRPECIIARSRCALSRKATSFVSGMDARASSNFSSQVVQSLWLVAVHSTSASGVIVTP